MTDQASERINMRVSKVDKKRISFRAKSLRASMTQYLLMAHDKMDAYLSRKENIR